MDRCRNNYGKLSNNYSYGTYLQVALMVYKLKRNFTVFKENLNASRPSEHPPVRGEKMPKRLGGIIGCKYKTSSWCFSQFVVVRY